MTWDFLKRHHARNLARPIQLEFHSGMGFDIPLQTATPRTPEAPRSSCFGKVLVTVDPNVAPTRPAPSRLVAI
jgi:hypothetical protein